MTDVGAWIPAWERATRTERVRLFAVHHRRFLMLTPAGRARVRQWFDAQQRPIVVELYAARCTRIAGALRYFGDPEPFGAIVDALARLPRPVIDHVITRCMVLVTGRSTNGWTTPGRLPGLRPIVLAGDRADVDVARTFWHEVAHRWNGEERSEDVATAAAIAAELREIRDRVAADTGDRAAADRFVRDLPARSELEANALAIAWTLRAEMMPR